MKIGTEADSEGFKIASKSLYRTSGYISLRSLYLLIKSIVFKTIFSLFPFENESYQPGIVQVFSMYALGILETFQLLSLMWKPKDSTQYWENYKFFWQIAGYARFDNICASISLLPTCFYMSMSFITCEAVMLALLYMNYINKLKESTILRNLITKSMGILTSYLYIPVMTLLMIYFKYSAIPNNNIKEYNIESLELSLNITHSFGIIYFIFLYFLTYVYYAICYDSRHTFSHFNINSRAHSKIERLRVHLITCTILLYAFFGDSHQEVFRSGLGTMSFLLALTYLKYQPFYSKIQNVLKISMFSTVSCVAIFLEFGYLADNSNYSFILTIIVTPFAISIIFYKSLQILSRYKGAFNDSENMYDFELRIRSILISQNDEIEILTEAFSGCYKEKNYGKNPMMVVWLTNYCFYTLGDLNLTRIKMGSECNSNFNIDSEFQIYRLRTAIQNIKIEFNEEIDYLNFRFKFEKVKKDDEMLCILLLEFLRQMRNENNLRFLLSNLIPQISKLLDEVYNEYEALMAIYPKSSLVLELYAEFLETILNQDEKSQELLKKKNNLIIQNQRSNLRQISYFDEDNGLMIISGASESFAIITFANETVGRILRQPEHDIVGSSISSYVPYPFNINHSQHMYRFMISCSHTDIKLPLGLFLQTQKGYLVECYIQVKCTALDGTPFFLVLMKERTTQRGIAILSNTGTILNHNENFSLILNAGNTFLKDQHINNYLDGVRLKDLLINIPKIIYKGTKAIAIIKSFKNIKNKKVDILYLVTDEKEILGWRKGKYNKETEYDEKQRMDLTTTIDDDKKKSKIKQRIIEIERTEKEENALRSEKAESVVLSKINSNAWRSHAALKDNFSKGGSSSTRYSNSLASNPHFRIVLQFFKKFKIFSCLMFIVVLGLQAAIIIYISLFYGVSDINELISHAETSAIIANIGLTSRSIQLASINSVSSNNEFTTLSFLYSNLTAQKVKIRDTLSHSECEIHNSFQEVNALTLVISKTSYLTIIENILLAVKSYLSIQDPENLNYIIINSILASESLMRSYQSFSKCEVEKVNSKRLIADYLTIASVTLSCMSIIAIAFSLHKISKHYSLIWLTFCKLSNSHTLELNGRVVERLIDVHKRIEFKSKDDSQEDSVKRSEAIVGVNMYIWRFFMYLGLLASFYVFLHAYTMPKLEQVIHLYPQTITKVYDERIYAIHLNIWIREYYLNQTTIDNFFPVMTLFESPELNVKYFQNILEHTMQYFLQDKLLNQLQESTVDLMLNNNSGFLGGINGMMHQILLYSYDIDKYFSFQTLSGYEANFKIFETSVGSFSNSMNIDFKNNIKQIKAQFKIVSSIYCVFTFFLFIIVFNYMMKSNEIKIKHIQKLGEFIPIKNKK